MPQVKRLVLDVLKPHSPNALEFCEALAALGTGYRVTLKVTEVDEKTETTVICINGNALDFPSIESCITDLGGSVHSIDEVEVSSDAG
jgi:hypothetical protein